MAPPGPDPAADRIRSLTDLDAVFSAFDSYPWAKDSAFLAGLAAILGEPAPAPAPELVARARAFYYAQRIGVHIDLAQYQQWLAQHPGRRPPRVGPDDYRPPSPRDDAAKPPAAADGAAAPALPWQQAAPKADLFVDRSASAQPSPGSGGEPAYPIAFADMLQLLQQGKPIPGIRQIPNTIVRDPSVKPVGSRTAPRKPWEKDGATAPPETELAPPLDTEFPPLDSEAPESQPADSVTA